MNEHDLVFKVTSPTGKPCATSLTTNKNGIIDIIIKFEEPGDHILSVTHNGKKVIGSDVRSPNQPQTQLLFMNGT